MECGVEQGGVNEVARRVGGLGEGELGVEIPVVVSPGSRQTLEGGAVAVAVLVKPLIDLRRADRRRVRGWPVQGFHGCRRGAFGEGAGGVLGPGAVAVFGR